MILKAVPCNLSYENLNYIQLGPAWEKQWRSNVGAMGDRRDRAFSH